jgi:hypothetical protein
MIITVEPRWFVCIDGCPVGSMYDQFDRFEVIFKNKYPFHKQGNNFKDFAKAAVAAEEMKGHVREVMSLPDKMKKGRSAQYWKLEEDEKEEF